MIPLCVTRNLQMQSRGVITVELWSCLLWGNLRKLTALWRHRTVYTCYHTGFRCFFSSLSPLEVLFYSRAYGIQTRVVSKNFLQIYTYTDKKIWRHNSAIYDKKQNQYFVKCHHQQLYIEEHDINPICWTSMMQWIPNICKIVYISRDFERSLTKYMFKRKSEPANCTRAYRKVILFTFVFTFLNHLKLLWNKWDLHSQIQI